MSRKRKAIKSGQKNLDSNQVQDNGLRLKVLRSVLSVGAGFVLVPWLSGTSLAAEGAPDGSITRVGSETNLMQNNRADIYAEKASGGVGLNRFEQFKVGQNQIANLYFATEADKNTALNTLVNTVNSRIDIYGTVNAIRNNKIGGNLYFLSVGGMVVGSQGVINAGSLTAISTTQDKLPQKFKDELDIAQQYSKYSVEDALRDINSGTYTVSGAGPITINGTINATTGIDLRAATILVNKADGAEQGPKLSTGVMFNETVNTNGLVDSVTVKNEKLNASVDKDGKIVISDQSNVDGGTQLTGDGSVKLKAMNKDQLNEASSTTGWFGLEEGLFNDTVAAKVEVDKDAQIDAIGNVEISANAESSIEPVKLSLKSLKDIPAEVKQLVDYLVLRMSYAKASTSVDGKISGADVKIASTAKASYKWSGAADGAGEAKPLVEYIQQKLGESKLLNKENVKTVLDFVNHFEIPFSLVDAKAETNIGTNADIAAKQIAADGNKAGGNVNIAATSNAENTIKIKFAPEYAKEEDFPSFLLGAIYEDTDSSAVVNVNGKVHADNDLAVTAEATNSSVAKMQITEPAVKKDDNKKDDSGSDKKEDAGSESKGDAADKKDESADSKDAAKANADKKDEPKHNDFAYMGAVSVVNESTKSEVNLGNLNTDTNKTELTAGGEVNINSTATTGVESEAVAKTGSTAVGTMVNVVLGDNSSSLNAKNGTNINGASVNMQSENILDGLSMTADNDGDADPGDWIPDVVKTKVAETGKEAAEYGKKKFEGLLNLISSKTEKASKGDAESSADKDKDAENPSVADKDKDAENPSVADKDKDAGNASSADKDKDASDNNGGVSFKNEKGESSWKDYFGLGVSVGVASVSNSATTNVEDGVTITATGKEGDINIGSKASVADANIVVKNILESQTDEAKASVAAGVAVEKLSNTATTTINGQLKSEQGNISATADTEQFIRLDKMISDLEEEWDKFYKKNKDKVKDINSIQDTIKNQFIDSIKADYGKLKGKDKTDISKIKEVIANNINVIKLGKDHINKVIKDYDKGDLKKALQAFLDEGSYSNMYVSTASTNSSSKELTAAVSGNIGIQNLHNDSTVNLGSTAKLEAGKDVNVNANVAEGNILGIGKLGWFTNQQDTGDISNVIGGSVGVQNTYNNSKVNVANGVQISSANINLGTTNDVTNIGVVIGGATASSAGVTGMVAYMGGDSSADVQVDDDVTFTAAKAINIAALNDTNVTAVVGDRTESGSVGVGVSTAVIDYDVITKAEVHNTEETDTQGQGTFTANAIGVSATTDGTLNNITIAGVSSNGAEKKDDSEDKGDNKVAGGTSTSASKGAAKDGLEKAEVDSTNEAAPGPEADGGDEPAPAPSAANDADAPAPDAGESGGDAPAPDAGGDGDDPAPGAGENEGDAHAPGADEGEGEGSDKAKNDPKLTIAAAGSVSWNAVDNVTKATLDNVKINLKKNGNEAKASVNVTAQDDSYIGAYSGAMALTKLGKNNESSKFNGTLSGAIAVNDIAKVTQATLSNTNITADAGVTADVLNYAVNSGAQVATGLSIGAQTGKREDGFNVNLGASGSANYIDSSVLAKMQGNTISVAGASVGNVAYDKDIQVAGGVTAQYAESNNVSLGAAVSINKATNNIQATMSNNKLGSASASVDEVQNIAASKLTQVGTAVSVGVSSGNKSYLTGEVAVNNNVLKNNVSATVDGGEIYTGKFSSIASDGKLADAETDNSDEVNVTFTDADGKTQKAYDLDGSAAMANANGAKGADVSVSVANDKESYTNSNINLENQGNTIVGVALGLGVTTGKDGSATSGTAAAAASINKVENSFASTVKNATIKTGASANGENAATVKAASDTSMVSVAAGVAAGTKGGEKVSLSLAGSGAKQSISNNTVASVENANITTDKLAIDSSTKSTLVSVAGQVSADLSSKGGAGGLAWAENALDNTTGAYAKGLTLTGINGGATNLNVSAANASSAYAIGAGAGVSLGYAAAEGAYAANHGTNNTEAVVDKAGDKRTTINNAESVNVSASDNSTEKAVAGTVAVAAGSNAAASIGGAISYNNIGSAGDRQQVKAALNNADITTTQNGTVNVAATNEANFLNLALGGAVRSGGSSVGVSAQGSVARSSIYADTFAGMANTNINSGENDKDKEAVVKVGATSNAKVTNSADAVGVSVGSNTSIAGVAAVSSVRSDLDTTANITGSNMQVKDLTAKAAATNDVLNIAIGGAVAAGNQTGVGVAGSIAYNNIGNDTNVEINNSTAKASGTVAALANSKDNLQNYGGAMSVGVSSVGAVAAGATVVTNTINSNTSAVVNNSTITALGGGDGVDVNDYTVEKDGSDAKHKVTSTTAKKKGLVVNADAEHVLRDVSVTTGVAFGAQAGVAVDATVVTNTIKGSTSAEVNNTSINNAATGDVTVSAHDKTDISSHLATVGVGAGADGAGIGLAGAVDTNNVARNTLAQIKNDEQKALNAKDVDVKALGESKITLSETGVAAGASATVGVSGTGTVSTDKFTGNTNALVSGVKGTVKSLDIAAERLAQVNTYNNAVSLAGGTFGGAVGAAVTNIYDNSSTNAELNKAELDSADGIGKISVKANNNTEIKTEASSTSVAVALGGAVGASVLNVNADSQVGAKVTDAKLGAAKAFNTVNVMAENDVANDYTNMQGTAGLVGISVAAGNVNVNTKTSATVQDSEIHADNVAVTAAETRKLDAILAGATLGLGAVGVNSMSTTINGDVQTDIANSKLYAADSLAVAASAATDAKISVAQANVGVVNVGVVANKLKVTDKVAANISNATLEAGKVTALVAHDDNYNISSDTLGITVAGVGAAGVDINVTNDTALNVDSTTITSTNDALLDVENKTTMNKADGYEKMVSGAGVGALNVNTSSINNTLTNNAQLKVTNSKISSDGDLQLISHNDEDLRVNGYVYNVSAIGGAEAKVTNTITNNSSVELSGSELKTTKRGKDITVSAADDVKLYTNALAEAATGVVAGANAILANTLNRNNVINIANNSSLYSTQDINLFAGKNADGSLGTLDMSTVATDFVGSVVPVSIKPTLNNTIAQGNNITIDSDSASRSVRHSNLYASRGREMLNESVNRYTLYSSSETGNYTTTNKGTVADGKTENNFVKVDGTAIAGVANKINIKIGEAGDIVIVDNDLRKLVKGAKDSKDLQITADGINKDSLKFGIEDYTNTLFQRYVDIVKLISEYAKDGETSAVYQGYLAEANRLLNEMQSMGLVTADAEGNLSINGSLAVDYVEIPDLISSGGNITVDTNDLEGSGTLKAQGNPEIIIENNTNLMTKINSITVDEPGGKLVYNGQNITGKNTAEVNKNINALNKGNGANFTDASVDASNGNGIIKITGNYSGQTISYDGKFNGEDVKGTITPMANILIQGNVYAKNGDIEITRKNNGITIQGKDVKDAVAVVGQTVKINAATNITQGYTDGLVEIGGSTRDQYEQKYQDIIKNNNSKGTHDLGTSTPDGSKANGSYIAGGNVYINASDINVNGTIQSGYGDYTANITDTAQARIDKINNAYTGGALSDSVVTTGEQYKIIDGGAVWNSEKGCYVYQLNVYYNPSTNKIIVQDVDASGGKIYLTGRISSTGNGKIICLDGASDINVTNNINYDLKVGNLTTNDVQGLISIRDTAKNTLTEITKDKTVVKELVQGKDGNVTSETSNGSEIKYNPKAGLQYTWTTGKETIDYTKYKVTEKVGGWFFKWSHSTNSELLDKWSQENNIIGSGKGEEVNRKDGLTIRDNGTTLDKNVVEIDTDKFGSSFTIDSVTRDNAWWKYYDTTTINFTKSEGTRYTYDARIKADNPIDIKFIGKDAGQSTINVTAKGTGNIELAGNIGNTKLYENTVGDVTNRTEKGTVNITAENGAIMQTGGSLYGSDINLAARKDITGIDIVAGDNVNLSAVQVDFAGNTNTALEQNQIDLIVNAAYGAKGNVQLGNIGAATKDGNVFKAMDGNTGLTGLVDITTTGSEGNITQASNASIVGDRINLTSNNGGIYGSKNADGTTSLKVYAGQQPVGLDTLDASINAKAQGDINLEQTSGNMRLGQVISTNGDVTLTINNGDLVDALPYATSERGTIDDMLARWKSIGLIDGSEDSLITTKNALNSLADGNEKLNVDKDGNKVTRGNYTKWNQNALLYAIQDSIVNPTSETLVKTSDKDPNIIGHNITINSNNTNGNIGLNGETKDIDLKTLLDADHLDDLKALAKADASTVTWGKDTATIKEQLPVGVRLTTDADGKVGSLNFNATEKNNVFLEGRTEKDPESALKNTSDDLVLGSSLKATGTVTLESVANIYQDAQLAANEALITANALNIYAYKGTIGTDADKLTTSIGEGGLNAIGRDGIYINQLGDKNLMVNSVSSAGDIYLGADKSLQMNSVNGDMNYIRAEKNGTITLEARGGSLGEAGTDTSADGKYKANKGLRILNSGAANVSKVILKAQDNVYVTGVASEDGINAVENGSAGTLNVEVGHVGNGEKLQNVGIVSNGTLNLASDIDSSTTASLYATKDLTVEKSISSNDVYLGSEGNVTLNGSNVAASNQADVVANSAIKVTDSQIKAAKQANIHAKGGAITLSGAKVDGDTSATVNVVAANDVLLDKGSSVAGNVVNLMAGTGNNPYNIILHDGSLTATNANLNATGYVDEYYEDGANFALDVSNELTVSATGIDNEDASGYGIDLGSSKNKLSKVVLHTDKGNVIVGNGGVKELKVSVQEGKQVNGFIDIHNYEGGAKNDVIIDASLIATGDINIVNDEKDIIVDDKASAVTGDKINFTAAGNIVNEKSSVADAADVTAKSGITLTAGGNISNDGKYTVANDGDIKLDAKGAITNNGAYTVANGDVTLAAGGDITNTKDGDITINKNGHIQLQGNNITNAGDYEIHGDGGIKLDAKGNIKNEATGDYVINGEGSIELTAGGNIENGGGFKTLTKGNITIKADGDIANVKNDQSVSGDANFTVKDGNITLTGKNITNYGDYTVDNGNITLDAQENITNDAKGDYVINGDGNIKLTGNDVSNSGDYEIHGNGNITLDARNDLFNGGNYTIGKDGNINLQAAGQISNYDDFTVGGTGDITIISTNPSDDERDVVNSGKLTTNIGNVSITAEDDVFNFGVIGTSKGDIAITSNEGTVYNRQGADLMTGAGNVTLTAKSSDNQYYYYGENGPVAVKEADRANIKERVENGKVVGWYILVDGTECDVYKNGSVFNAGDIMAKDGVIKLTSDHGDVTNYDDFSNFELKNANGETVKGSNIATSDIEISAAEGAVYNSKDLESGENITLTAKEGLGNFAYNIYAGKNITLHATAGDIHNTSVLESVAGDVTLLADNGNITNGLGNNSASGDIVTLGGSVKLEAKGKNADGTAHNVTNYGDIVAIGDTVGDKAGSGSIILKAEYGDVNNYDDFNTVGAGDESYKYEHRKHLSVKGITDGSSYNVATSNIEISAANGKIYNDKHYLVGLGDVSLTAKEGLGSYGDVILAGGDITLTNTEGSLMNSANLVSMNGDITLNAEKGNVVNTTKGQVIALNGNVTMNAGGPIDADHTIYLVDAKGETTKLEGVSADVADRIIISESYYLNADGTKHFLTNTDTDAKGNKVYTQVSYVDDNNKRQLIKDGIEGKQEAYRAGDVVNRGDIVAIKGSDKTDAEAGNVTLKAANGNVTNYDDFKLVDNGSGTYHYKGADGYAVGDDGSTKAKFNTGTIYNQNKDYVLSDSNMEFKAPEGYLYNDLALVSHKDITLESGKDLTIGTNFASVEADGNIIIRSLNGAIKNNSQVISNNGSIILDAEKGITSVKGDSDSGKLKVGLNGSLSLVSIYGDINVDELFAGDMAAVGTKEGNINIGQINGKDVIIYTEDADSTIDVGKIKVDEKLFLQGNHFGKLDVDRSENSGTLYVDVNGVSKDGSAPVSGDLNMTIDGDADFRSLNVTNAEITVGGKLSVDKMHVGGAAHLYTPGMKTGVFGIGATPKADDSNVLYFDANSEECGKGGMKLTAEQFRAVQDEGSDTLRVFKTMEELHDALRADAAGGNAGADANGWMNLYVDSGNHQTSNGLLLRIDHNYYAGLQRWSAEDLSTKLLDYKIEQTYEDLFADPINIYNRYDLVEVPAKPVGELVQVVTPNRVTLTKVNDKLYVEEDESAEEDK